MHREGGPVRAVPDLPEAGSARGPGGEGEPALGAGEGAAPALTHVEALSNLYDALTRHAQAARARCRDFGGTEENPAIVRAAVRQTYLDNMDELVSHALAVGCTWIREVKK